MATRGATLGGAPRARRRSRRTLAVVGAVLLSMALVAGAYGTLTGGGTVARSATSGAFKQGGMLSLPLAARAPVSRAIGGSQPAYRVREQGSGLTAWSAPQRLSSSFTASGVSVRSGHTSVSMHLTGVGYGPALSPVGAAAPRSSDNRVTYSHPGLQEWYANGPLGLEQGFTVSRAPAAAARGPLTFALSLDGSSAAQLSSDRKSINFGSPAGALRYTGLAAEDANGRPLASWLSLSGGTLLLHVRAAGARYPVRVDPFVQSGEALSGKGATVNDQFGTSVAISGDGKTAIVGASEDGTHNPGTGYPGAAFVFVRSGAKWEQQGEKLVAKGGIEPTYFGDSVALSANGNTAIVGAYLTNGFNGAAYVFTRTGSTWEQQGEPLLDSEKSEQAEFGWSVALSSSGNTAVIGGPDRAGAKSFAGGAWVFTRTGEAWSQQGTVLSGEEHQSELGYSVALSAEGTTALIGADEEQTTAVHEGSAFVYVFSAGKWSQQAKLTPPGTTGQKENGFFGTTVALSGSGNTALVGAPNYGGSNKGGAFAFTRAAEKWTEQEAPPNPGTTAFAGSVALSGEGTAAVITRKGNATGAWAYTFTAGKWSAAEKLENSGGSGSFGKSASLSENGQTAILGGSEHAWAFEYESPGPPPEVVTSAASEVAKTLAQFNGTVNPRGKEVTECKFEYGTSTGYGSSVACGSPAGKGEAPVAVFGKVENLTANTVYHFRVVAKTSAGTSRGEDRTLTTLNTSDTGETAEIAKPAEAEVEGFKVKASEGVGKVTIGPYGSNIGGPPLAKSEGKYMQVYHSEGASFKKMEYEDCELGNAKTLWYENPRTGWEPIEEPVAVYNESTECIKVTATESTKPDIAELSDPRHVGGPAANQQVGKCEPFKHGHFEDSLCQKEDFKLKKEVRSYKGKYEWFPAPVGCFALKKGHFEDPGCTKEDFKEKKGVKSYKGKYEKGLNSFKVEGGPVVLSAPSEPNTECTSTSSSSSGLMRSANQSLVTLTFTGCERAGAKCASVNEMPGTIVSEPMESYSYEEGAESFTTLAAKTMLGFTCAGTEFRLSGAVGGLLKASFNSLITGTEVTFSAAAGAEELELEETKSQTHTRYPGATLTTTTKTTTEQPLEIKVKPPAG
ncbi:MAG TPA: hypothetical protein VMB91_04970 [Solirubrobacteraceae bacterium]|nr:hypothetical protein [Solirubrobacteraceae bacterium]